MRLAVAARKQVYGQDLYAAPVLSNATLQKDDENDKLAVVLRFELRPDSHSYTVVFADQSLHYTHTVASVPTIASALVASSHDVSASAASAVGSTPS